MKIASIQQFNGPSLFSEQPVFTITLQVGEISNGLDDNNRQAAMSEVVSFLPESIIEKISLFQDRQSTDELKSTPDAMVHLFCQIVLILQKLAETGPDATYKIQQQHGGEYRVLITYLDGLICRMALRSALQIMTVLEINARDLADQGSAEKLAHVLQDYERSYYARFVGNPSLALIKEAGKRNIPWHRLSENEYLVVFGQGVKQKQTSRMTTIDTSLISTMIAKNKNLSNSLMHQIGIPAPHQIIVSSSAHIERLLQAFDGPVVVKPIAADGGKGVSISIDDNDSLIAAIDLALKYGNRAIIEQFIEGDDHRLLVVGGKFIAAAKRLPALVTGDGSCTVEELVDIANQDPRRGTGHEKIMQKIALDREVDRILSLQNQSRKSVPEKGVKVRLRGVANIITGGTSVDVTDIIHPDNIGMAERVVRAVGLDICGLDFLTPDISKSYLDVGGGIAEINHSPGMRPHWLSNPDRDVVKPIMENIIPASDTARIPIVALLNFTGNPDISTTVSKISMANGQNTGLSNKSGVFFGGNRAIANGLQNKARIVLRDYTTDIAILDMTPDDIFKYGLETDSFNVGVILYDKMSVQNTLEDETLVSLKTLIAQISCDYLILNSDDPHSQLLTENTTANQICIILADPQKQDPQAYVKEHKAVVSYTRVDDKNVITIFDGDRHIFGPNVGDDIGSGLNLLSSLYAVSIAYSMKIPLEHIHKYVQAFQSESRNA